MKKFKANVPLNTRLKVFNTFVDVKTDENLIFEIGENFVETVLAFLSSYGVQVEEVKQEDNKETKENTQTELKQETKEEFSEGKLEEKTQEERKEEQPQEQENKETVRRKRSTKG